MCDHSAFRKAIEAAPDDDLVRLVFADRLDECGEGERAAFIRGQIEAARRPAGSRVAAAALRRAAAVFDTGWLADDLPALARMAVRVQRFGAFSVVARLAWDDLPTVRVRVSWRRGFVGTVEHPVGTSWGWFVRLPQLLPPNVLLHPLESRAMADWPTVEPGGEPGR